MAHASKPRADAGCARSVGQTRASASPSRDERERRSVSQPPALDDRLLAIAKAAPDLAATSSEHSPEHVDLRIAPLLGVRIPGRVPPGFSKKSVARCGAALLVEPQTLQATTYTTAA